MGVKTTLLQLNIVEDNEYLDKYCNLIESNKETQCIQGQTHRHHIIPKSYYKINNLDIDNSKDNLINLLFKDHVLAHYYLALCSNNLDFKYANELAFSYLTNNDKYPIKDNEKDILMSLSYYQKLYEEGCKIRGRKNTGKKRTEEIRQKMSEWQKGKPKSEEAKRNMSEAQKNRPKSIEDIMRLKEIMAKKSSEERKEIAKKIIKKIKGRIMPDEEKIRRSMALKGKPKSDEHKKHLSEKAKMRTGEKASNTKLKEQDVVEILKLLKNNFTMKDIAEKYNISISCVSDIKHKRNWSYLCDLYPELYDETTQND